MHFSLLIHRIPDLREDIPTEGLVLGLVSELTLPASMQYIMILAQFFGTGRVFYAFPKERWHILTDFLRRKICFKLQFKKVRNEKAKKFGVKA